jgi:hypothetical protein
LDGNISPAVTYRGGRSGACLAPFAYSFPVVNAAARFERRFVEASGLDTWARVSCFDGLGPEFQWAPKWIMLHGLWLNDQQITKKVQAQQIKELKRTK